MFLFNVLVQVIKLFAFGTVPVQDIDCCSRPHTVMCRLSSCCIWHCTCKGYRLLQSATCCLVQVIKLWLVVLYLYRRLTVVVGHMLSCAGSVFAH